MDVSTYITSFICFVSSYVNFFSKLTLFHFQKKMSINRVKIKLILKYSDCNNFSIICVAHIL